MEGREGAVREEGGREGGREGEEGGREEGGRKGGREGEREGGREQEKGGGGIMRHLLSNPFDLLLFVLTSCEVHFNEFRFPTTSF